MKKTVNSVYTDHTADVDSLTYKSPFTSVRISLVILGILIIGGVYMANVQNYTSLSSTIVIIDPQHPSAKSSKISSSTIINDVDIAKVNWEVSQKIVSSLNRAGIKALTTINSFGAPLSPEERARVAIRNNAKIFVRIDCSDRTGNGFAVYYPEKLQIYNDLEKKNKILKQSQNMANVIFETLKEGLKNLEETRGIMSESYLPSALEERSSYFAQVPVVTIEMGTLTYLFDALFVSSEMGQDRLAETLTDGIIKALNMTTKTVKV